MSKKELDQAKEIIKLKDELQIVTKERDHWKNRNK